MIISAILKHGRCDYLKPPNDIDGEIENYLLEINKGRNEIINKFKNGEIVIYRHILCFRLRARKYSFPQIAKSLNLNHTTVMSAVKQIENRIQYDNEFEQYKHLIRGYYATSDYN